METKFEYNDGGRAAAGYEGKTGDCVCRAIAIVTGKPYQEIYDVLANGNATQRQSKYHKAKDGIRTASRGINTNRVWFQNYMESLGFTWTPTMKIGQGCKVHLRASELPKGRLVVAVSKHYTAMIDGVIHDIYNPQREGSGMRVVNGVEERYSTGRCVYGYYTYNGPPKQIELVKEKEVKVIAKPDKTEAKLKKLLESQKKWQTKFKRAENALKKLNKQIKRYESKNK